MKTTKRILVILLAMAMLLGTFAVGASAATDDEISDLLSGLSLTYDDEGNATYGPGYAHSCYALYFDEMLQGFALGYQEGKNKAGFLAAIKEKREQTEAYNAYLTLITSGDAALQEAYDNGTLKDLALAFTAANATIYKEVAPNFFNDDILKLASLLDESTRMQIQIASYDFDEIAETLDGKIDKSLIFAALLVKNNIKAFDYLGTSMTEEEYAQYIADAERQIEEMGEAGLAAREDGNFQPMIDYYQSAVDGYKRALALLNKPVVLGPEKGITVTAPAGVLTADAKLAVAYDNSDSYVAQGYVPIKDYSWDIDITPAQQMPLAQNVTVRIPKPAGYSAATHNVVHITGTNPLQWEIMSPVTEGADYLEFETNHFSPFAVWQKQSGTDKPAKGIFGTNPKWDGKWWHYVLFFVCFGFVWMWF